MTENELRDQDIESVCKGAAFLSSKDDAVSWAASKAWKKGYYAGREAESLKNLQPPPDLQKKGPKSVSDE